jgi:elongation of very long chain fatty acids protein 4
MCKRSINNNDDTITSECSGKRNINLPKPFPPSILAQYTCLAMLIGVINIWAKYTFVSEEDAIPTVHVALHNYKVPLVLTGGYLLSLPILKHVHRYLSRRVDVKEMLQPCMIWYNVAQVLINLWMVYRFIRAVAVEGHPFIGNMDSSKCVYVVWVHYTNKYLEFLDTVFMVLRGKMDQVCTHF